MRDKMASCPSSLDFRWTGYRSCARCKPRSAQDTTLCHARDSHCDAHLLPELMFNYSLCRMKQRNIIKLLKMATVLGAAVLSVFLIAVGQSISISSQGLPSERVAPDDGLAFVIHFIGDTHGALGPCG